MQRTADLSETRQTHAAASGVNRIGSALLRALGMLLHRCTARNERLAVRETLSLGGRRSVALIECDGHRFLAGMSANGVETLVPVNGAGPQGGLR